MALVVDERGAILERGSHGTVALRHPDGRVERVGLRALGAVVIHGDVGLSTGLLQALAANEVSLTVLPLRGRWQAVGFSCQAHRLAAVRHAQHMAYADGTRRLAVARQVVAAKLESMAAFADAETADFDLGAAMRAVLQASDIAGLMGVEGTWTRQHFAQLRLRMPPPFLFDARLRQPAPDPVNALMSLSYTLAQAQAVQLALRSGLDVQLGFLHGLHRDRQSLALDLLEPARPALDSWVLELLRRKTLTADHFAFDEAGSCRLIKEGRTVFYPLWFRQGCLRAAGPMRRLLARLLSGLRALAQDLRTETGSGVCHKEEFGAVCIAR